METFRAGWCSAPSAAKLPVVLRWALFLALGGCGESLVALDVPPEAFAGFDRSVPVGALVGLDARDSRHAQGVPLTYAWSLLARPDGSAARIEGALGSYAEFLPDRPGTYVAHLVVTAGPFQSADLLTLWAQMPGQRDPAPELSSTFCQGVWQESCGGDRVHFGGPENLEVQWLRAPLGVATATLSVANGFSPPRPGDYWLAARVAGSTWAVASFGLFEVDPEVEPRLQAPQSARVGERLLLDGRGSGTEHQFTLVWDPSEGASSFDQQGTGCPLGPCRRLVPRAPGDYLVGLSVMGNRQSATRLVLIEVRP